MKLGSTSLMQGIAKDSNYQTPDWDRSRNCLILELLNCNNGIFPPESKGTSIFGYPTLLVGFLIWNKTIPRGFLWWSGHTITESCFQQGPIFPVFVQYIKYVWRDPKCVSCRDLEFFFRWTAPRYVSNHIQILFSTFARAQPDYFRALCKSLMQLLARSIALEVTNLNIKCPKRHFVK